MGWLNFVDATSSFMSTALLKLLMTGFRMILLKTMTVLPKLKLKSLTSVVGAIRKFITSQKISLHAGVVLKFACS
jgi:hypothetical protein